MNDLLLAGHRARGGISSFQQSISIADQVFSSLDLQNLRNDSPMQLRMDEDLGHSPQELLSSPTLKRAGTLLEQRSSFPEQVLC